MKLGVVTNSPGFTKRHLELGLFSRVTHGFEIFMDSSQILKR